MAVYRYAFPVDRLVRRFKLGADLALGAWLAGRLAEAVRGEPLPALLVAPPMTAERLRQRGFNPALVVARHVGRALGVPVDVGALVRTRETAAQRGLGARDRLANQRGSCACRRRLAGQRVAIVDDVVTTGATVRAVACALAAAGAGPISAWAVARTP